jgi:hypothetical protein
MTTLSSHLQSTPSFSGQRLSTSAVPEAQASQRKVPGLVQSQKLWGPASPRFAFASLGPVDASAVDASVVDPREPTGDEEPQPIEAPTTTIV